MLVAGRRFDGMDGGPGARRAGQGCPSGPGFLELLLDEPAEVGILIVAGDEGHELALDLGITRVGGAQVG